MLGNMKLEKMNKGPGAVICITRRKCQNYNRMCMMRLMYHKPCITRRKKQKKGTRKTEIRVRQRGYVMLSVSNKLN